MKPICPWPRGLAFQPQDASQSRAEILAAVASQENATIRPALADFFRGEADRLGLGEAQCVFLLWHFSAPDNYGNNYESAPGKQPRSIVVGWNVAADVAAGKQDWTLYTFSLVGCTCVVAYAPDGSAQMSHFDQVVNAKQIELLGRYMAEHRDATVVVVGVSAAKVASAVAARYKPRRLLYHVKPKYFEEAYPVRARRRGSEVEIAHAVLPMTADFIPSIHNNQYGRWFSHGRFGEMYPPRDEDFRPTEMTSFQPGAAADPRARVGRPRPGPLRLRPRSANSLGHRRPRPTPPGAQGERVLP